MFVLGISHHVVLSFDNFKSHSPVPLLDHFFVLFRLKVGRGCKLKRPKRKSVLSLSTSDIVFEVIYDNILVVISFFKCPHVVFFKAVINVDEVRIRRVGVKGLSLNIVEVEYLIIVVHRDDRCGTNDVF